MGLVGQRRGRLTIVKRTRIEERGSRKLYYYLALCDCGRYTEVSGNHLARKQGPTLSCGCLRSEKNRDQALRIAEERQARRDKEAIGKRYGRLRVLQRGEPIRYGSGLRSTYLCECDCGKVVTITANSVTQGYTRSCGCLRQEATSERTKRYWADYRQRKNA